MTNIQPFIIIQFGLTAFQHIREENTYTAETFNFYLLPRSIPTKNRHFLWQVTALEFLTLYNFNFNKVSYLYKGLTPFVLLENLSGGAINFFGCNCK